jgi:hypothetical protein
MVQKVFSFLLYQLKEADRTGPEKLTTVLSGLAASFHAV